MSRPNKPYPLTTLWCVSIFVFGACIALSSAAQETPSAPQSNRTMQEMMKLMMPGEGHKIFSSMTGKWTGKLKIWNSMTPTAPPVESATESEIKTILGGRFVVETSKGSMMNMSMERMSILGYDNVTKNYTLVFYSNLGTAIDSATGSFDDKNQTLTLRGFFNEPTGKVPFKNIIRNESNDVRVFESYKVLPDGRELKVIEETYTRAK